MMNTPASSGEIPEIVPQMNPTLPDAIRDAQLILAHAAKVGIPLDQEIVKRIVDIGTLVTTQAITPDQEAEFWQQRNHLAKAVAPLTVESLRAQAAESKQGWILAPSSKARKAELRYRWYAIFALFFLLIIQVYWLFGSSVTTEIAKTDKELTETYEKENKLNADKAAILALSRAASAKATAPASDSGRIENDLQVLSGRIDTLEMRQQAGYRLLEEWAWPWSWLVPESTCECDTKPREAIRMNAARFQTSLTMLDVFQRYVLALLYGFLGACVFVLRTLSDEIKAWVYSETSDIRFRIRLYLGTLGGMIIAWFVAPESGGGLLKSLSPFALAFLAGYSVELLFAAMDKVIAAFAGSPATRLKNRGDGDEH